MSSSLKMYIVAHIVNKSDYMHAKIQIINDTEKAIGVIIPEAKGTLQGVRGKW